MITALQAGVANYVIDILAIIVIIGVAIVSAKKGFAECLFGLLSTVAAALVAFIFMKPVLSWTGGLFGLQGVTENGCINALLKIKGFNMDISNQGISEVLAGKDLPKFLIDAIIASVGNASIPVGTTLAMLAGEVLGGFIVGLIAWIVVFLVAKLLLTLLKNLVCSVVENLPIISSVNTLLGFVLGVAQGLLIISAIIAVLSILPIPGVTVFFNDCFFVGLLYNHNPINVILGWILV